MKIFIETNKSENSFPAMEYFKEIDESYLSPSDRRATSATSEGNPYTSSNNSD